MKGNRSIPSRWVAGLALLVLALFAVGTSAHSVRAPPVRRLHHPARSSLRILPRGGTPGNPLTPRSRVNPTPKSLRHDDTLMLTASIPSLLPYDINLLLRPNDNLFHPNAKITYQSGEYRRAEPLRAADWRMYHGQVIRSSWENRAWAEEAAGIDSNPEGVLGSARVMVHNVGEDDVEWEGVFTVLGVDYHVLTREHYELVKTDDDVHVAELGNNLVVFADTDMHHDDDVVKRGLEPLCSSDRLAYNANPLHPARAGQFDTLLARDDYGGAEITTNYADKINSTAGCPTTRKVVYMGVAIDCNYVSQYGRSTDRARTQVLNDWNMISGLFADSFKISLGIIELIVQEADCPKSTPQDVAWNVNCSDSITLDDRLNTFSAWRGSKGDDGAGLWHLMTACSTDTEVGVAWLGTICNTESRNQDDGTIVSSTGVSTATATEWSLVSHEIGHNFGAIHDCSNGCSLADKCCPLTAQSCSAGGTYIMNPTTAASETRFSPCTLGNICTFLGDNSKSCIVDVDASKTVISLDQCGNGIVEGDEECDPGSNASSKCCDPATCKFTSGSVCDPANSLCCTDSCQLASAGVVCRASIDKTCDQEEVCSGTNATCPDDVTAKDGTGCGNGLACASGHCTSPSLQCQKAGASLGLNQACGQRNDQTCKVTCKDPKIANQCTVLQTVLIDGSPCGYGGHCYEGNCKSGPWTDFVASAYKENLQISIPITIAAALIIFAIIYWLARCCFRACSGGRSSNGRGKTTSTGGRYPPPPPMAMGQMSPIGGQYNNPNHPTTPLMFDGDGRPPAAHHRTASGSYSDELGPGVPMTDRYQDPYAAGSGGYGHPSNGDGYFDSSNGNGHGYNHNNNQEYMQPGYNYATSPPQGALSPTRGPMSPTRGPASPPQADWVDPRAYNGPSYSEREAYGR